MQNARSTDKVLVVQNMRECPPGEVLRTIADAGFEAEVVNANDGQPIPSKANGFGSVVLMGGFMNAGDDAKFPYLLDELKLIENCVVDNTPTLGICLGAQLGARALGGRAYAGNDGRELGWIDVQLNDAGRSDPVMSKFEESSPVFQWHGQTFDVPDGATLLARSARYNQAYRLGSFVGVQFHPEVNAEIITGWQQLLTLIADGPDIPPTDQLLVDVPARAKQVSTVVTAFLEQPPSS